MLSKKFQYYSVFQEKGGRELGVEENGGENEDREEEQGGEDEDEKVPVHLLEDRVRSPWSVERVRVTGGGIKTLSPATVHSSPIKQTDESWTVIHTMFLKDEDEEALKDEQQGRTNPIAP